MESPVCSVWGNKRSLTCQPYQSLHPSPIDDPDAQSYRTTDSSPSTTTGAVAPSEFYEYEPQGSSSSDVDAGEDESGTIRKAGYDSSDELDNVKGEAAAAEMAELRDVMEAERRKRRRRSDFAREDVRIVYLDRRALDQGGQGSVDTFEACPKVVKREQSDYFEFVVSFRRSPSSALVRIREPDGAQRFRSCATSFSRWRDWPSCSTDSEHSLDDSLANSSRGSCKPKSGDLDDLNSRLVDYRVYSYADGGDLVRFEALPAFPCRRQAVPTLL